MMFNVKDFSKADFRVDGTLLDSLILKKQLELLACIDLISISKFKIDVINVCFWHKA